MSREVKIGTVKIGNGNRIAIQSMTTTKARNIDETVDQINRIADAGADIVRFAIENEEDAKAVDKIRQRVSVPIVADIHFNHKFALECIAGGIDKIRINPGNIGSRERVAEVAKAAIKADVPIRIGVNLGSIEKQFAEKYGKTPKAMVESAKYHASLLENEGMENIVISLKASDVKTAVAAYRQMAGECDYPLHLGITEAGTVYQGIIKSAAGIGALLLDGIGDTIRVSLTANPVEEVKAAKALLSALDMYDAPTLVSCPTCGRCNIDLPPIANAIERYLENVKKPLKVAVMGCAVNGPGEASDADFGIAGGQGNAVFFKKGKIIKSINENEILDVLFKEIDLWEK
ncbi:MAG: flavodoxin-dependent (E)-4-hydroxy-3-methylbut-2-enyl-diphosphate synthase [Clostridia bacterium]|nr:flavodoxin-dependent (E)-4-hydroxy-3-methylbut-2-enyl-diphosphate synthase [Clostridia bacterium]